MDADVDGGGSATCVPGAAFCEGGDHVRCLGDGRGRRVLETCRVACDDALGCIVCTPGTGRCVGEAAQRCAPDGSRYDEVRDCGASGAECAPGGFCDDDCGRAERRSGSVGCRFFAAPLLARDLSNSEGQTLTDRFDFRVVVRNESAATARVAIRRGEVFGLELSLPAGESRDVVLPWVPGMTFITDPPDRAAPFESLVTRDGAYELVSDKPISAVQFNPFQMQERYPCAGCSSGWGTASSGSQDATSLLPHHVLAGEYMGLTSYAALSAGPTYLAIVGAGRGPTNVHVRPPHPIAASATGEWATTERGEPLSFTVGPGDVVHLVTPPPPPCSPARPVYLPKPGTSIEWCREDETDLSGAVISADGPIAVFGGGENVPVPWVWSGGGHIEAQLPPLHTWDVEHLVVPVGALDLPRVNFVRVVASEDDTELVLRPRQRVLQADGTLVDFRGARMRRGEVRELEVSSPCRITSSAPVLVGQFTTKLVYLEGTRGISDWRSEGNASFTVVPPVSQHREHHGFFSTTGFYGPSSRNYALVIRPNGAAVSLDGLALEGVWQPVGFEHEYLLTPVTGGAHEVSSPDPVAVFAYGFGYISAYLYSTGGELRSAGPLR